VPRRVTLRPPRPEVDLAHEPPSEARPPSDPGLPQPIASPAPPPVPEPAGTESQALPERAAAHAEPPTQTDRAPQTSSRGTDERARVGGLLRVDAERVDRLGDLLGDAATTRARIEHEIKLLRVVRAELRQLALGGGPVAERVKGLAKSFDGSLRELDEQQARLGALLASFDAGLRDVRHVAIEALLERVPRVARDVAEALGKQIGVQTSGATLEVDKQLIDALAEPLLHLVRNAIDHGIEAPAERRAHGKPERGRLSITAQQSRDRLELVISDDGGGIDLDRLKASAVRAGLLDDTAAREMPDSAALELVFAPGLSTRSEVSEFSGRGIGLDIVRARAGALGGDVAVRSTRGNGTTFVLSMPLRLAIARAVVVELDVSGRIERYAIPTSSVLDVGRLEPDQVRSIAGAAAVPFRDQFALVADLGAILGVTTATDRVSPRLVYIGQAKQVYALEVDRILGEREIITRSLGPLLVASRLATGAAVLEDGRPALVLNPGEVLVRAGLRTRGARVEAPQPSTRRNLLVVEDSIITRSLIADALRTFGYEVAEADNGLMALEKLAEARYDLVLTDLEMPQMDGFELLRRIRSDEELRDLPVIVCTSLGAPEDKRRALSLGATAYIVKSEFSERALGELVQRLVD